MGSAAWRPSAWGAGSGSTVAATSCLAHTRRGGDPKRAVSCRYILTQWNVGVISARGQASITRVLSGPVVRCDDGGVSARRRLQAGSGRLSLL
jgi:hypothetical protein